METGASLASLICARHSKQVHEVCEVQGHTTHSRLSVKGHEPLTTIPVACHPCETAAPSGPATQVTLNFTKAAGHRPQGVLSTPGRDLRSVLAETQGPFSFRVTSTLMSPPLPASLEVYPCPGNTGCSRASLPGPAHLPPLLSAGWACRPFPSLVAAAREDAVQGPEVQGPVRPGLCFSSLSEQ